jgi:4-hydroxyproline epimerase
VRRISIIDSHTGGEPTRLVVAGGPNLGGGPLAERKERFHRKFDSFRSAIVNEPRGSDVIVGALLMEPEDPSCATGVIFFNNVGFLGMCGHGTIGLVATLAHLGKLKPGDHRIETPVGVVTATLHADGCVSVANVPSWRARKGVAIAVPGGGTVIGDVAWGGNWFYLLESHGQELAPANTGALTDYCWRVRQAVNAQGFPEIDHVELLGPPTVPGAHSRNFVQCPGKAYDRSPCGTGTSAKLACLAADGRLAEGDTWIQESIIGSRFSATFRWLDRGTGKVVPTITGTAFVNAEATLLLDEEDPFCWAYGRDAELRHNYCWRRHRGSGLCPGVHARRAEGSRARPRDCWGRRDRCGNGPPRRDGRFGGAVHTHQLFTRTLARVAASSRRGRRIRDLRNTLGGR